MAYKMGKPSLLKMVSALKNKQKGHFLERNAVGPIATKKEVDHMKNTTLEEALHNKHADKTEGTIEEQKSRRKNYKKYSDLEKHDDDR